MHYTDSVDTYTDVSNYGRNRERAVRVWAVTSGPVMNTEWPLKMEKKTHAARQTSECVGALWSAVNQISKRFLVFISSPGDEASGDSRPRDTAGVWLLALLLLIFAAAAQAAQVDGQTQEVDAECCSGHAAQEDERLGGGRRRDTYK